MSIEVFCPLLPGKPNHNFSRTPGQPDTRPRIPQGPQKGDTCGYYAANLIRERYGKASAAACPKERELECWASLRRKELTVLSTEEATLAALASPEYAHYEWNQKDKARAFVESMRQQSLISSDLQLAQKLTRISTLLDKFVQSTHPDIVTFSSSYCREERDRINLEFLAHFSEADNWGHLSPEEKTCFLDCYAGYLVYAQCYRLSESRWRPTDSVTLLINELRERGPLYVKGMFGKSYYVEPPCLMKQKIHGRELWFWPPEAPRKKIDETHAIVIVGAATDKAEKNLVYFVDPVDGSNPANPEQQKIYVMSYRNLCANIRNLLNAVVPHEDIGYAFSAPQRPAPLPLEGEAAQ